MRIAIMIQEAESVILANVPLLTNPPLFTTSWLLMTLYPTLFIGSTALLASELWITCDPDPFYHV